MPIFLHSRLPAAAAVCLNILLSFTSVHADMDPRFKIDPQALASAKNDTISHKAPKKHSRSPGRQSDLKPDKGVVYTVKPGDHVYKILRRDYGLSTSEASQFMAEIRRANNMSDFELIKAGRKIVIPPVRRGSDGVQIQPHVSSAAHSGPESDTLAKQTFKLESPVAAISEQEAVTGIRTMWNRLIPSTELQQKPLVLQTPTFSFSLGPERYHLFGRMDGGRIVVDPNGSIPALVKTLIENKDSSVRIVSEEPPRTRRFMASLLNAAGFYSVEEDFSMDFGVDPKLTLQFDFKVEKTADSLINQDVDLVNSSRSSLTPVLGEFLKKEGFSLYEPFASFKPSVQTGSRAIYSISSKKQTDVIDSLLTAFSVSPEQNRRVDVFTPENNGFSLSVKSERYFERGGQRYVVTSFDGDPINYTLFRILETKGYKVVILEASDDFRKISEKLISRMKIKGAFAQHVLLKDGVAGYALQMSGFKLEDAMLPGGGVFLTDRAMDRVVRDLFIENGFNIYNR